VYFTENVQDIDPYFGIKSYDLLYQLTLEDFLFPKALECLKFY